MLTCAAYILLMIRGYLFVIVMLGVSASMMSNLATRVSSPSETRSPVHGQDADAEQESSGDASEYEARMSNSSDHEVRLERNEDGHFYADVEINGARVHALVDTGATGIALSREDARSAGIATSIGMPGVVGRGADGDVHGEIVMLDRIALGGKAAEQTPAAVLNAGEQSLLGQSFLSKFDSVEIRGDTMVLR